jgi:hypothetical protein
MQSSFYPDITHTTAWEGLAMWGLGIIALVLIATVANAITIYKEHNAHHRTSGPD